MKKSYPYLSLLQQQLLHLSDVHSSANLPTVMISPAPWAFVMS